MPYPTVMEVMGPYKQVPREQTASYKRIFFKGSAGEEQSGGVQPRDSGETGAPGLSPSGHENGH